MAALGWIPPPVEGLPCRFAVSGYKQGTVDAPPTPAVTKNVSDFRTPGMDDTGMLKAALKWAHARPASAGEASHTRVARQPAWAPRLQTHLGSTQQGAFVAAPAC